MTFSFQPMKEEEEEKLELIINPFPSLDIDDHNNKVIRHMSKGRTEEIDTVHKFSSIVQYHKENIDSGEAPPFKQGTIIEMGGMNFVQHGDIKQDMKLTTIVVERCPMGWEDMFRQAWPELVTIEKFLEREEAEFGMYYPLKKDLFKAFELCPLWKTKVVIFGQDPYHSVDHDGLPTAQGLSFSVRRGADISRRSIKNVFRRMTETVDGFTMPSHGDVSSWAKQGVLMLNITLTVRPGKANSHKDRWMPFINRVIKTLVSYNRNIIYMLWGGEAQKMERHIGARGHVLKVGHPSGLSYKRGREPFCKMDHFNQVNQILREQDQSPIDWRIPP